MPAAYSTARVWPVLMAALFVLLVVQSGILLPLGGSSLAVPNLVLLFGVCMAIVSAPSELVVWAVLAGFLLDFFSPTADGIFTVSLLAISAVLLAAVRVAIPKTERRWPVLALLTVGSTVLFHLFGFLSAWALSLASLGSSMNFGWVFGPKFFWEILLNLIFLPPVYYFFMSYRWLATKVGETK